MIQKVNADKTCSGQLIFLGLINKGVRRTAGLLLEYTRESVGVEGLIGTFRLDYEYEYDFSILVIRLHIIATHTHFIPCNTLST